jgi:D-alanine-D-alanine ligase
VKGFKGWFRKRRIAVILGGNSAEREISLKTGRAILASLKRQKFNVVAIDAARSLPRALQKRKINYAYIALHGTGGEDGQVQGLLEWLEIPYTGSGVLASALAMDKAASKQVFKSAGLPMARGVVLSRLEKKPPIRLPLVVKPVSQGSAVGVSLVKRASEWLAAQRLARRYGTPIMVEEYLCGCEVTVGVLGKRALPVIEILPQHDRAFYDFHAKYAPGGSRHILPARISPNVARQCQTLALQACRALGTRGASRVDFIVDERRGPCLLEVNTIPGMTETSLLPEAARAAGIDFDALVVAIAEESRRA